MDETPVKRTVRAAFWDYAALLAGKGLTVPLMLLVMAMMARLLGKEGFGQFTVLVLVGQFFFLTSANWPGAAVVRFGREEFLETGGLGRTFWATNAILAASVAVAAAVVLIFRKPLLEYIGTGEIGGWVLVAFLVVLAINTYAARVMQATEHLRALALANPLGHAVTAALLVAVWFARPGWVMTAVIGAYLAGKLASGAWGFWRCGGKIAEPVRVRWEAVKRILAYSYPLILGTLCGYVVSAIDVFVIKHFRGTGDVGVYNAAYQGLNVLNEVPLAAMTLAAPLVMTFRAEKKDDLTRTYVDTVIPGGVFVWGLAVAAAAFAARVMIPVLFGTEFAGAVLSFRVLCVAATLAGVRSLYYAVYTNYDMTRSYSAVTALLAGVNVAADIVLVPRMGIVGAAIGTTIAFAVAATLDIIICQRKMGVRQRWQVLLALPVLVYAATAWMETPVWADALIGAVVIAGALVAARLLGMIHKGHVEILEQVEMPGTARTILVETCRVLAKKL